MRLVEPLPRVVGGVTMLVRGACVLNLLTLLVSVVSAGYAPSPDNVLIAAPHTRRPAGPPFRHTDR